MAKFTINIVADNSKALQSVAEVQQKLNDIERHPIEIKIDANGNTDLLKQLTKLEQAKARTASANAKIVESENKVKIARAQTRTETARGVTEEKKAETAKRQATLETKKATTAEKQRQTQIEKGNAALKQKQLQEERTATKTKEIELVEKKAAAAAEKRAASEKKATANTNELGEATEKTAKKTESLWDNFQKFARWYIIGNAFSSIVRSMKDALETMKAVDDELVTIRKVTGFSNEQIAGIQEKAYSTASAYGVGAADYLESVAAFSRAGYKEQAAALAELSTKTQIVGDTTAEVANQFLLSVDAAYQYKGSIEQLTRVLDGANEIDNKYATSIEKIAEGMGIVAPVAEQMHVGVNELAAAIGTITAVTQRSGSEAARALRALFLNIVGDTKTEIDEGVTWTTGEIAGLKDVIRQFAPEAYNMAQAMGTIIDPMEAIGGLAKSMQEGLLTEKQLMSMVSDIGGKLRTSQLLALIQNWDMYQSMLTDYAGAIGSADKEVENALDSWTRKTNQLKNAWAEFVSHLVDSGEIKAGIDLLTGLVKALDSGVGFVIAFTAGIVGLAAAIAKLVPVIEGLNLAFMSSPLFLVGVAAAAFAGTVVLIDNITHAYEKQKEKLQELQAEYDKLYGESGELESLKARIGELTEEEVKRLGVLQAQKQELAEQLKIQQQRTFSEWRKTQNTVEFEVDPYTGVAALEKPINLTEQALKGAQQALSRLNNEWTTGLQTSDNYNNGLKRIVTSLKASADAIRDGKDSGEELTETEAALLDLYDSLTTQIGLYTAGTEANTQAKEDNADASDDAAAANETLKTAFEEVEKNSTLTYGTLDKLDKLYPGLSAKIIDANGNLTAEGKAALSTKAAFFELVGSMIAANTTALNFDAQIAELQRVASEAGIAAAMVSAVFSSLSMGAEGTGDWDEIANMTPDQVAQYRATTAYNSMAALIRKDVKDKTNIGTGGGGGGGGGSQTDEWLESLKNAVSLEKQRLSFLEASDASAADQVAKMRDIQAALHDQAEYMRSIGADEKDVLALSTEWWSIQSKISKLLEEDTVAPLKEVVSLEKQRLTYIKATGASEEEQIAQMRLIQDALKRQEEEMRRINADEKDILAVTTEWYNIQNDIADLEDKIAEKLREDIAKTLDDIVDGLKSARQAMLDPLQAQLDALIAAHDATEERREEEEKIAAVQQRQLELEKARIALENAQKQRTVRQYNAARGQWEWVANAKEVESAQKNLETAQKNLIDAQTALAKYYSDKEYEAAKENLENQIANTNSAFDALKDAIEEAAQAIRDGKMSYEEAYAYIKQKMRDIYNDYGVDLTGVLNTSITGLTNVSNKIKSLLSSLSAETQASANEAMDIIAAGEDAANGIALFTQYIQNALQTNDPEKAIKELSDAIRSGIVTNLNDVGSILAALNGEYAGISSDTAKLWALTKMQANSIAWHMTEDAATKAALHAENVQLGTAVGLTYNSATGTWHDKSGQQVYTLNAVNGAWSSSLNNSALGGTGIVGTGGTTGTTGTGSTGPTSTWTDPSTGVTYEIDLTQPTINPFTGEVYPSSYGVDDRSSYMKSPQEPRIEYDENGNIKSVTVTDNSGEDFKITNGTIIGKLQQIARGEKPIGSYLQSKHLMFEPETDPNGHLYMAVYGTGDENANFEARIFDRGGILRGRGGIKATTLDEMVIPPAMTAGMLNAEMNGSFDALLSHLGIITSAANAYGRGNIGSQHNGDVYEMNGVTISEGQARVMTVYDLAQLGKSLALHRGS